MVAGAFVYANKYMLFRSGQLCPFLSNKQIACYSQFHDDGILAAVQMKWLSSDNRLISDRVARCTTQKERFNNPGVNATMPNLSPLIP